MIFNKISKIYIILRLGDKIFYLFTRKKIVLWYLSNIKFVFREWIKCIAKYHIRYLL